ncbi:1,4-dihydroxy-2-naphthoate octaprenyltransferase [Ruminiclostridium sufflavum DSM 19573]|uniref:1,4-dihydroxy-2-naphthoate octaprenyltransferase n=1 Tax=Ruminiclostridium sufflavum DSM 19573 TaxID=1121337 RepID=A0A318XY13_9FIRM|nr:UbiA family prenyltransferase [Ruminiclostridium sufflavum]PYG87743.1 1,4-dihydroxy-2-naphthoate octaprenyltransferase [Ruminiclostridium sufflavum DSM 19573]
MIKKLFDYIEIKTKITSLFAFFMTMAYIFYIRRPVNWELTLVFFGAMFIFDLATTAINNYIDTKTNHQILVYTRRTAKNIIFALLGISTALGLYLSYRTDIIILITGGVCFACGIFYTFGPVPISRQPLGELFSGIFYGLLIPFILLYINLPEGAILSLELSLRTISLNIHVVPVLTVLLLSIAPVCTTANIMLANNICDLERDVAVKRYTLPYYLGHKAVYLFAALNYFAYSGIIIMAVFRLLPPVCLLAVLAIFPVQRNIKIFLQKQEKETTFICSIKNYVVIMGSITLAIFISALIRGG